MPTTASPAIHEQVTKLYDDYVGAVLSRDLDWLEQNLAEDFMLVIPDGGLDSVIGKQDYITNVRVLKNASIEMGECNVLVLGRWATVQFTATIMEELADIDSLDAEARAARERAKLDSFIDVLAKPSEHYYTGILRRKGDGWEVVVHSFLGPVE